MIASTEYGRLRRLAGRHGLLTREREIAIATLWLEHRDRAALDELVRAHFRLVIRCMSYYPYTALSPSDLFAEGCLGLMTAADKFDPSLGNRFSTYARNWVYAAMQDAVIKNIGIVKLGGSGDERRLYHHLARTKARLCIPDGEISPSNAVLIADVLGVAADKVIVANRRISTSDVRMDARVGEDGDGETYGSLMPSHDLRPDQIAEIESEDRLRADVVAEAMSFLSERERVIITQRYLVDDRRTLEDLSQVYGVSRERIRQIEVKALKRIRDSLEGDPRFDTLHAEVYERTSNQDQPLDMGLAA